MKPYSEACERNRDPILAVLREAFADRRKVLEIGSGTGQHAVHFAAGLPHLAWQPSDRAEHLRGIRLWCDEAELANLLAPIALDVNQDPWPDVRRRTPCSAPTRCTSSPGPRCRRCWSASERCCRRAVFSPSTARSPMAAAIRPRAMRASTCMLRDRDPRSGIRSFEDVDALARAQGLSLVRDVAMPANNRTLVWRRPA